METILILALLAIVVVVGIVWRSSLRGRRVAGQPVEARAAVDASTPEATVTPPVAQATPLLADEPIAAAAPLDASPATLAADLPPEPAAPPAPPEPPAPAAAASADLIQLKGLGPKLAATLADLGFTRIDQIAALTPAEAADLDARLGAFQGRMARDRWIEQAKLLSAGDKAGYEAEFGKLG